MVSSTVFRSKINLFLALGKKSGITFKMVYNNRVWLVSLEPTDEKVPRLNPRYKHPTKKGAVFMPVEDCSKCPSIVVGGICINKNCPTNLKAKAVEAKAVE